MKQDNEELDMMMKDMFKDDEFKPTFPEKNSDDNLASTTRVDRKALNEERGRLDKKKKLGKTKVRRLSDQGKKKNQKSKKSNKTSVIDTGYKGMIIQILRFITLGSAILFFLSMFFGWFSLSGNGFNYGYIRGEETREFLEKRNDVYKFEIANLVEYKGHLATFSPKDLYSFSGVMEEDYFTVMGPDDQLHPSIVSKMHYYYMRSILAVFLLTLVAIVLLAVFKGYTLINIVRNIAVINALIVGLNYMVLKIPYFSMFAIRAKDLLSQTEQYSKLSMTKDGIAMDQKFYPYILQEKSGIYFALFFLGMWFIMSIILSEVKNKDEEKAIENGEIN